MKKHYGFLNFVLAFTLLLGTASAASANAILAALNADGVKAEQMSDSALSEVRGTGFVYGLVDPSCTYGIREYQVTWKKFGDKLDFRSYNWIGYGENSGSALSLGTGPNGVQSMGFGDVWLADLTSSPNAWNRNNAVLAEYHLKVMDVVAPGQGAFNGYGYTESYWNRPLSTFIW